MKRTRQIFLFMLALLFVFTSVPTAFADEDAISTITEESTDKITEVLLGWKKIDGKTYYFDKNGKAVVGLKTIGKNKYYFNKSGVMMTGWKTISGKKYYFKKSGDKAAAVKGRKQINKKWYFFNDNGTLQKKTVKKKDVTYYINSSGNLEAYRKKSDYYKPNGKKMTAYEKSDYTTLQTARKIVAKITNDKMSKEKKLSTCFWWVSKKPYKQYRKFRPTKDWPSVYANDHFKRKGGDCHADGAAFAYLARALGYKDVYVCLDCDGKKAQGHCWTEINGKVYDPLFVLRKNGKKKCYGGSYKAYRLRPVLHLKVAKGY